MHRRHKTRPSPIAVIRSLSSITNPRLHTPSTPARRASRFGTPHARGLHAGPSLARRSGHSRARHRHGALRPQPIPRPSESRAANAPSCPAARRGPSRRWHAAAALRKASTKRSPPLASASRQRSRSLSTTNPIENINGRIRATARRETMGRRHDDPALGPRRCPRSGSRLPPAEGPYRHEAFPRLPQKAKSGYGLDLVVNGSRLRRSRVAINSSPLSNSSNARDDPRLAAPKLSSARAPVGLWIRGGRAQPDERALAMLERSGQRGDVGRARPASGETYPPRRGEQEAVLTAEP